TAIINGLNFAAFGAPSSGVLGASWSGATTPDLGVTDSHTLTIVNNPTVNSGSNQTLSPPGPVTANTITITDGATPGIWNSKNLRITIPAGLNTIWNTGVTTVGIIMSGSGAVSTTLLAYEDSNKTAVLNVTTDFGSGSS